MNSSNNLSFQNHFFATMHSKMSIAAIFISFIGLLANIYILYVLISDTYFHKTTYYLIRISVFSDIISTSASIGGYIQIAGKTLDHIGGTLMCKYFIFIIYTSYGISMMTLCLISIDRYYDIIKPYCHFYRFHKTHILIVSETTIWLVAISVNLPILSAVRTYQNYPLVCDFPPFSQSVRLFMVIFISILYIIPSFITGTVYLRIVLHQRNFIWPGEIAENQMRQRRSKKKKFVKMLSSIALSNILITWPLFATLLGMTITQKSHLQLMTGNIIVYIMTFFSVSFTTSISIISPFLYLLFDCNIRNRSKHILTQLCKLNGKSTFIVRNFSLGKT